MKRILMILSLCLIYGLSHGQKIVYSYDSAGNQIKREVIYMIKRAVVEENNEEQVVRPIEEGDNGEKIVIYPNPTKGEITVDMRGFDDFKEGNVVIVDMKGKIIFKDRVTSDNTYIDISSSPTGSYIMTINIDGNKRQWKIIKVD